MLIKRCGCCAFNTKVTEIDNKIPNTSNLINYVNLA